MSESTPPVRPNRPVMGALFVALSGVLFAIMGAVVKHASGELPNQMVVFFRNFGVFLLLVPQLFWGPGKRIGIRTTRFRHHFIRSASGLSAMYCYFYALGKLPLSEAVLLSYTSPLLTPIVARLWMGEPYGLRHLASGLIGFFGIILILRPGSASFEPAALVALCAALLASIAMTTIRNMSDTEPPFRIVAWFTLISTCVSAGPAIAVWDAPDLSMIFFLVALGVVAFSAQISLTTGYTLAPAAQIGPFTYLTVFFAAIIGNIIWKELPHPATFVGGALIVAGGILATRGGRRIEGKLRKAA